MYLHIYHHENYFVSFNNHRSEIKFMELINLEQSGVRQIKFVVLGVLTEVQVKS